MKSTSIRGLKALVGLLWSHRLATLVGLLALMLADAAQVAVPLVSRQVIDGLGPGQGPPTRALLIIVGLGLLAYLSRCLWRYCLFGAARKCDVALRQRIYEQALRLPQPYHATTTSGHLMSLATSDIMAVRMVLAFALMSAFDALAFGLMSVGAMFYIDAQLALWTLIPFPFLGFLMAYLLGWEYRSWDRVQESIDRLTEKARESLSGMKVLRSLVQAEGDCDDFRQQTGEQYRRFMAYIRVDALYSPSILVLAGSSSAILLGLGGRYVAEGRMSVGDFAAFASFLAQLTWPMIAVAWSLSLVQRGAASMERILSLLEQAPEPEQAEVPQPWPASLRASGLSYRYPSGQSQALEEVSFEIAEGASLGIVGEVGSGKSTLTRLLLRLYEPPAATLWLGDQDITQISLTQLRSRVAWVEQESFLFSQSIAENLRLGKPEATLEELEEVCRQAHLHAEILSFPKGYETMLGERGVTLSGGQKQRLCLARALLKPASVLVLDDTLSAVDGETEAAILEALRQRRGQQTCIVISHRVSSVRELDNILVLERGRVIQSGTHQQLLEQSGLYARLFQLQSQAAEVSHESH